LESAVKNGSSIRSSTLNHIDLPIVEAKFRFVSRENLFALSDRIHETALIAPTFN
jgi:hypothetical protein